MKKLLQINSVLNCGSTGRIAEGIGQIAIDNGWDSYIAYGRQANQSASNSIRIGNKFDIYNHVLQTRLFDKNGFASKHATKKLIAEIKTINPDVIHLQNLHGYYINLPILFEFLQRRNKPVVWTLVDCWAFTGHCSYFDVVGCNRWITGCYSCPQKKSYPASYVIDNSSRNYELKKSLFNLPQKMTIVVHCNWLKNNVRQSYLNDIPVELIHNGIDVSKFYPRDSENLKKKLGIQGKFIILGVANQWTQRLGFNDFIEISKQ